MPMPKYDVPKRKQSDKQLVDAQYVFKGAWLPSLDPARIGPENYKILKNLRYSDDGIEGVLGDSEINITPISTYTKIWNGFQLRTDRTQKTYTLVHAVNPADGQGRVYENRTDITVQGGFEATQLHTDLDTGLLGRFSDGPGGTMIYCNSSENRIYAGDEIRTAGLFLVADANHTLPEDHTDRVNNTLSDSSNIITYAVASKEVMLVFSTRPLENVQFTLSSVNAATATLSGEYFNGSWTAVSNPSDGTSSGGVTLAQDGTFSFDSTVSDAEPFHFEGLYMFAYRFTLAGAGATADIAYITLGAPWQGLQDIWDGVYRQPIQFQFHNASDGAYEDYTLHVNQSSTLDTPIGGVLDAMTASDTIILMFEERMSAVKLTMLANLVNTNAQVLTIKYWNGSAYAACSGVVDGTLDETTGTKSFAQTGLISWNPPAETSEHKRTLFGTTGYTYQISVDGLLSGTEGGAEEIVVDICTGVPAQQVIRPFKFSGLFKGRVMLGNYAAGKEGNRMDYTMRDAPEVWNGFDSSLGGVQSLYFGGMDGLQSAVSLFNRFGSQVFAIYLVCKNNETYVLDGDNPEDYVIYPVSYNIGNPAPLTMDTAEIGFEMAQDVQRNVAIWLSYGGPVMFDGAVLRPIKGLESYFDPNSDFHITFDSIAKSRGHVDITRKEYNLLLPMDGSTDVSHWYVYDLVRKKWFEKDVGISDIPQCGFRVSTEAGSTYSYLGTLNGQIFQNENGTTWDTISIESEVAVGDFWPSENVWHRTRIRYILLVAKKITEDVTVAVYHFPDTDNVATDAVLFRDDDVSFYNTTDVKWAESATVYLNLSGSNERLIRVTKPINKLAWSHGFSFILTTNSTKKAFKPIVWGIRWEYERHELGN